MFALFREFSVTAMEKVFTYGEDWNRLREEMNRFLAPGILLKHITCEYQFVGGAKVTISYEDLPQDSGKFIGLISFNLLEHALRDEMASYKRSYAVVEMTYASLMPLGPSFCVAILKV